MGKRMRPSLFNDILSILKLLVTTIGIVLIIMYNINFSIPFAVGIEVLGAYYLLIDEIVLSKQANSKSIDLRNAINLTFKPSIGVTSYIREGKHYIHYGFGKFISKELSDVFLLMSLPNRIKGYSIKYFGTKEQMDKFCKITVQPRVFQSESVKELDYRMKNLLKFSEVRKLGYIYLALGLFFQFIFSILTLN
jgi:hypothetical protein